MEKGGKNDGKRHLNIIRLFSVVKSDLDLEVRKTDRRNNIQNISFADVGKTLEEIPSSILWSSEKSIYIYIYIHV